MAITKILNIMESEDRNPASHLKNALEYIQNPDKTEKTVIVYSYTFCYEITICQSAKYVRYYFHKIFKGDRK